MKEKKAVAASLNGRIVALAMTKGGTAKTTTAASLARIWSLEGHAITLHEMDTRGSASHYRENLPGVIWRLAHEPVVADPASCTIIDAPAALEDPLMDVISAADIVVATINTAAAYRVLDVLIDAMADLAPNTPLRLALTMVSGSSESYWRILEPKIRGEQGERVLQTNIPRSPAFEIADDAGLTLTDYNPRHPSNRRLRALADEIKAQVLAL